MTTDKMKELLTWFFEGYFQGTEYGTTKEAAHLAEGIVLNFFERKCKSCEEHKELIHCNDCYEELRCEYLASMEYD